MASRDRRLWIDDVRAAMDDRTRLVSLSASSMPAVFATTLTPSARSAGSEVSISWWTPSRPWACCRSTSQRTPVDFLAADGHKWMLGPEGAAVFYLRRELVDMLHPVGVGWNSVVGSRDFSRIDFRLKPHAGRWESGTLNVAGITALGASLELLLEIGVPAIAARILELTDYLCEQAAARGLTVYSSRRPEDRSGIVSLEVAGRGSGSAGASLPGGRCRHQPAGRTSPHQPALLQ